MFNTTAASDFHSANLDAVRQLGEHAIQALEDVMDLNIRTSRAVLADAHAAAQEYANVRDITAFTAAHEKHAQSFPKAISTYGDSVATIASKLGMSASKIAEERGRALKADGEKVLAGLQPHAANFASLDLYGLTKQAIKQMQEAAATVASTMRPSAPDAKGQKGASKARAK